MTIELPPDLPIGVRFHPTDQELITRYLRPKILGQPFDNAIAEIDLCAWEPWELPYKSKIKSKSEERMWWFMCRPSYKNTSSDRLNRTTETGFWKVTGQPRAIKDHDGKDCIGKKRTLVFHTGKTPGKRTNWVVQEYYLDPKMMPFQERASYVICRLKKKTDEKVDTPDGDGLEPSSIIPDLEHPGPTAASQQLDGQMEANHVSGLPYSAISLIDVDPFISLNDFNAGHELQMVNDESDESLDEFVNGLIVDPNEICYSEMTSNLFRDPSLAALLKRSYVNGFSDGSDTDIEGMSVRLQGQTEANCASSLQYDAFDLTEEDIMFNLSNDIDFGDEWQMENDESEECPDMFVDELIVDPHEIYHDGITSTLFRDSSLAESLKSSYFMDALGGGDMDAEGVSARYVQNLQRSSPSDSPGSSKSLRQMRMVNAREPLRTCAMSEDFGQENVVSVSKTLSKEDAFSCYLIRPVEIRDASSLRLSMEPPKHVDVIGGSRQKRIQLQKNSPSATASSNKGKEALEHVVTTANQPRKNAVIGEFRNGGKVAERSNVEKHGLESDKCESSSSKWKTIFFSLVETSSVSRCNSQPPLVYWFNAITGTVLFGFFVRALVGFGSW